MRKYCNNNSQVLEGKTLNVTQDGLSRAMISYSNKFDSYSGYSTCRDLSSAVKVAKISIMLLCQQLKTHPIRML